jgi:hypothetical protein
MMFLISLAAMSEPIQIGVAISDGFIDVRIHELRQLIAMLETRIKELEGMKGKSSSGGYPEPEDLRR